MHDQNSDPWSFAAGQQTHRKMQERERKSVPCIWICTISIGILVSFLYCMLHISGFIFANEMRCALWLINRKIL